MQRGLRVITLQRATEKSPIIQKEYFFLILGAPILFSASANYKGKQWSLIEKSWKSKCEENVTCTVGENIIATIKIGNNICYSLKMLIFPILR